MRGVFPIIRRHSSVPHSLFASVFTQFVVYLAIRWRGRFSRRIRGAAGPVEQTSNYTPPTVFLSLQASTFQANSTHFISRCVAQHLFRPPALSERKISSWRCSRMLAEYVLAKLWRKKIFLLSLASSFCLRSVSILYLEWPPSTGLDADILH